MILFNNDYEEGADISIINKLIETNLEQSEGYGLDSHTKRAKELIKKELKNNDVDIHFLSGGTETNKILISSALRPHQGVIAADTGHIAVHETGAIESTGHKVLTLENLDGKINAIQIKEYVDNHYCNASFEHTVQPKMVYISQPTESGTLYSKRELEDIRSVTRELGLYLYIDGARLGYAMASKLNDIEFSSYPHLSDAFYIGGTKCGALFGEALVIANDDLKRDFRYMIKQNGALLAKGRILGLQFEALFENGNYFKITKDAVIKAERIREAFQKKGIKMYGSSMTNQQFPILTDEQKEKLGRNFSFEIWEKMDDKTIVRFCTSWATKEEDISLLIKEIESL